MQQQSISQSTLRLLQPDSTNSANKQENSIYFCYTFIKQWPQAVVSIVLFILGIIIIYIACRQYRLAQRYHMINKIVRWVYITIFLWGALYQFKTILAQGIFWTQFHKQEPTPDNFQFYSIVSKYNFVIAYLTVFLAQTTVILVGYNWANNVVGIFEQYGANKIRSQTRLNVSNNKYFKYEYYCIRILRVYLAMRLIVSALLILVFLMVRAQAIETRVVLSMLIIIQAQSFLVVVLLTLGVISISRNKKLSLIIQSGEINTMIKQYAILIVCSAIRFLIDTVFFYATSWSLSKNSCYIDSQSQIHFISTLIFVMKALLAHYLTIFLVLKIYYVDPADQHSIVSFHTQLENGWSSSSNYKVIQ